MGLPALTGSLAATSQCTRAASFSSGPQGFGQCRARSNLRGSINLERRAIMMPGPGSRHHRPCQCQWPPGSERDDHDDRQGLAAGSLNQGPMGHDASPIRRLPGAVPVAGARGARLPKAQSELEDEATSTEQRRAAREVRLTDSRNMNLNLINRISIKGSTSLSRPPQSQNHGAAGL